MKTNSHAGITLRTTVAQLQYIARKKLVQALRKNRYSTMTLQEARQLEEAIRLLQWIRD